MVAVSFAQVKLFYFKIGRLYFSSRNVDPEVVECFHHAARDNNVNVIVHMLRTGVSVDCCDEINSTALHLAAYYNHIDIVNVLMDSGVNINQETRSSYTPLMINAMYNFSDVMEVLLHHGADQPIVDVYNKTILDIALRFNYKEFIYLFIYSFFNVDNYRTNTVYNKK